MPWEFEKNGRELNVRVDGQLVFNGAGALLSAALKGLGLAYLTEGQVQPHLAAGRLVRVLSDWCPRSSAITFTTQAPGRPHRLSPCWSMR
jgi:DNA-binding transcriptional LysR family regulator